jgi:hypothetical protein
MIRTRDLSPRLQVRRCRRRTSFLLLLLLAAIVAVVPVRIREIMYQRDPQTNYVWKTTAERTGYMPLQRFLARDRSPFPAEDSYPVRYALWRIQAVKEARARLNVLLIAAELGLLIALTVYDWIVFCRRRRRRFVSLSSVG